MNRLRHAYLKVAPDLEPYFTSGHHALDVLSVESAWSRPERLA